MSNMGKWIIWIDDVIQNKAKQNNVHIQCIYCILAAIKPVVHNVYVMAGGWEEPMMDEHMIDMQFTLRNIGLEGVLLLMAGLYANLPGRIQ